MPTFLQIDPVIFSCGPFVVRWYGLMYIFGFIACYLLVSYQAKKINWRVLLKHIDNLNLSLMIGVIIGGRLGYVLLYNLPYYLGHPLEIFATWQGGMSFHGGGIGMLAAGMLYCRFHQLDFWKVIDMYAVTVPIGLGFGRIGNFINGELYGRTTDLAWGIVFPGGGPHPRHPSQLYEALLEGVVLFILLWSLKEKTWSDDNKQKKPWPHGSMLALCLILYGIFRFFVEFFREPDAHLGLVLFGLTMGQLLCAFMTGLGILLFVYLQKKTYPNS
ncbi:MAG: prolipoprotein diacylglyceryl transferase [Candidatus Electrothrix sp. AR3]|nr:prolipoprotein diacylglyceryl transferase [Candidatus Electrothrix sp. AR3]